jgi:putative hemolysin
MELSEMPMLLATSREIHPSIERRLSVGLATSSDDIEAAQRLRYRVFAGELGARMEGRAAGRDEDIFDAWCEHLIVREVRVDRVVGTCRILTPDRAKRIGAFYADGEFDLTRVHRIRPQAIEIGRACIDAEYRGGTVVMLLWQELTRYMRSRGFDCVFGCASIDLRDGGVNAVRIYDHVAPLHLAPIEYRVFPRHRLAPREDIDPEAAGEGAVLPALLNGYLRLGAWIGGEPAWDPDFNTADLFVFLELARMETRYARHYLRRAA